MTETYSLMKNEEETKKFIEKVLQPLNNDEVYIAVLTARKKYCSTISSSMEVVSRDIIRNNDTNKILRKLRKMSVVENLYVDKNGDIIPIEAFSLYILPEPRSMLKAYNEFNKDINNWIYNDLVSETKNLELYRRLDTKLFSAIHRSKSKSNYFILDVDKKDEELLSHIIENIRDNAVEDKFIRWVSETHGGYHIILDRNEMTGKFIHFIKTNEKSKLSDVEIRKETMTPIVGCLQGGFIVKEYKIWP